MSDLPTVLPQRVSVAAAVRCALGEGPVWDESTGHLWFVDIPAPAIHRLDPRTGHVETRRLSEPVGFVVGTQTPGTVIAGLRSGLAEITWDGGALRPLGHPEPGTPGLRLNDGTVGPDGALYFGTMDEGEERPVGRFWRWDGASFTVFGEPTTVTNGPAFSPDGRVLYAVDSTRGTILAHPCTGGSIGEGATFVRFGDGAGTPDGLAVDEEGHVWVAQHGAARVTRFSPDGRAVATLPLHTPAVTKPAFGGPGLTTLYVTSAARGRDPTIDPMAGHVFQVDVGVRGLPSLPFRRTG